MGPAKFGVEAIKQNPPRFGTHNESLNPTRYEVSAGKWQSTCHVHDNESRSEH